MALRAISKSKMRKLMNISDSKLRFHLNTEWYADLAKLHYKKNDKLLSPMVLKYIIDVWWGSIEEFNND